MDYNDREFTKSVLENGSTCNGNRKTNAPSFRDKETHKIRINNVFP